MVETIAQGMDVDVGECRDDDVVFVSEAIIVVEDESDEDECSLTSGTTICEEDSLSEATTATAGADGLVNGEWNSFNRFLFEPSPRRPKRCARMRRKKRREGGTKWEGTILRRFAWRSRRGKMTRDPPQSSSVANLWR